MSAKSIPSNFNILRTYITRHGKQNFNKIRLMKLSAGSEAVYHFEEELNGLVPNGIRMIINGRKWFSAMSPCFKVLGNVLTIELDGLSMRYSPICTRKLIGHGTQVHVWGCFCNCFTFDLLQFTVIYLF